MVNQIQPEARTCYSELQTERLQAPRVLPSVLSGADVIVEQKEAPGAMSDHEAIQEVFKVTYGKPRVEFVASDQPRADQPLKVGVVLSGGQAPGGHNVIAGIYDGIKKCSPTSVMVGFLGGPGGIMKGNYCVIDDAMMDKYRNTGGFDMIASGRDKIESPEQFAQSLATINELDLDGLCVIGGDDSNTNAALLAEHFAASGSKCKVIGCPKTIDGDLKNEYIPISFGFDTACRTFSEEIGNVMVDTLSTQKYYHFVRLMGREAANVALECALQTRPNMCFIGEEVEASNMSLAAVTNQVVDMICARAAAGKHYGVVLLPEGLIGFIPEFGVLIAEINDILAEGATPEQVPDKLSVTSRAVFDLVPPAIQMQLMLDRDPHGNVQVAMIETEKLVAGAVASELERRAAAGSYGGTFRPQYHSFGYEGRCAIPTLFDANYCYCLGFNAATLLSKGETGLMSAISNLDEPVENWKCGGVPTTIMMNMERRHGKMKPVIKKAVVDLQGRPFQLFAANRDRWLTEDVYRVPGPAQFDGPGSTDITFTLHYELTAEDGNGKYAVDVPAPKPVQMMGNFLKLPPKTAFSSVETGRLSYEAKVPSCLASKSVANLAVVAGEGQPAVVEVQEVPPMTVRPSKIGVVFGEVASGVHSVLAGVHDFVKNANAGSEVLGFVGGVAGLLGGHVVPVDQELLLGYRASGGCDLLGCSEAKLAADQSAVVMEVCTRLGLQGLVLLGGADMATAAATLSDFFKANGSSTSVVACPCAADGSVKNQFIEASVGFDSTVKTSSQLVGNLSIDGASARKYWYFIQVKGYRSSHAALEIALQSNPNHILLIDDSDAAEAALAAAQPGDELVVPIKGGRTISDVVASLADVIARRSDSDRNFGTFLIPEGLVSALTDSMAADSEEKELADLVSAELKRRKEAGLFNGKFTPVCSNLGYQVRSSMPSNFDVDYGYTVGGIAAVLCANEMSGYMPSITGLKSPAAQWQVAGVPLAAMGMPIVAACVDLTGPARLAHQASAAQCQTAEEYKNPGPIQFVSSTADNVTKTLAMEESSDSKRQKIVHSA
mmetsp:Transcript_12849/g.24184  ORF Transcript_12849/g.24184 Transcript_12849/m.24184 type:complete len:1062 (+) Transcript_12849:98-3283(+)